MTAKVDDYVGSVYTKTLGWFVNRGRTTAFTLHQKDDGRCNNVSS